jgi:hypothetical protein
MSWICQALQQESLEDTTSDHALLEATRAGNQDAFAELVSRYRNQITSYIYRMTNDYDGAVDSCSGDFRQSVQGCGSISANICVLNLYLSDRNQSGDQ